MNRRSVKIARRVAIDYLVVGMAIASPAALRSRIKPEEMLTKASRDIYAAAIEEDREKFRDAFKARMGIDLDDERISEGIIRWIKETNVDHYAYEVGEAMSEELAHFDELADVIELLERATAALKSAKQERDECRGL